MALASWCTVSPMSGTGDATLTISATAHTGNTARTTAPVI
jgi:hypothetical protein